MNAVTRLAFAAVFCGLLTSAPLFAGEVPKDVTGELADSDPKDAVLEVPHKVHSITLEAGKAVIVDLESDDFDPVLRIEDAKGQTVAVDDDGGADLNSRAPAVATEKGTFKIIVGSLKGGGNYSLKFKAAEVALNKRGNLNQAVETHSLKMKAGTLYIISALSKDFDTFLRIEDAKGEKLAEDDDGGFGLNSRIAFQPPRDDDYKVIVTSFDGDGRGAYDISAVKGGEVAAPVAFMGQMMKGKLTAADPRDTFQRKSPAKLYTVAMKTGLLYTIDLQSEDFDAFLRLESPQGKPLKFDDDGGGDLNSRISFTPSENGLYRVIATSLDGGTGDFTLRVQSAKGKIIANEKGKLQAQSTKHRFKAVAGRSYVIDLTSEAFDTFLRLNDPNGNEVASDDDSGGDLNSRIAFTPRADGEYELIVSSFDDDGRGDYNLVVQEAEADKK